MHKFLKHSFLHTYLQTTLNILILAVEHIVLDHVLLEPWQQVHEGERVQHVSDLGVRICRINNHGTNKEGFGKGAWREKGGGGVGERGGR